MTIDINGIAHIQLSVRDMERSRPFYRRLLHETFGMMILIDEPAAFYCVGGRTGVMISPVGPDFSDEAFDQLRAGLHHVCFRCRSSEDIDRLHDEVQAMGARIVHPPEEAAWAPGYYSLLFEDPDGIRIEANYVPGRGHLKET